MRHLLRSSRFVFTSRWSFRSEANVYVCFCMMELTIGFAAAVRSIAAMACAVATFCSLRPVGSTKRAPVRPSESASIFIL